MYSDLHSEEQHRISNYNWGCIDMLSFDDVTCWAEGLDVLLATSQLSSWVYIWTFTALGASSIYLSLHYSADMIIAALLCTVTNSTCPHSCEINLVY